MGDTVLTVLSVLALVSALLNIRARYQGPDWQVYLFKPLTTILILLIAVLAPDRLAPAYRYLIVTGLFFSLWGDVFLMLPSDRFVAGLASFLVAHLFYIVAFSTGAAVEANLWTLLPVALFTCVLLAVIVPGAGRAKVAVAVYAVVISVMLWRALERCAQFGGAPEALACVGAVLFVISDSAIAVNRFTKPFAPAQAVILGTYFPAQWLIALSIYP